MITLDYNLSPLWKRRASAVDLASADETQLRYYQFLGNVIFEVDGHDFSPRWDMPIVDFTASLQLVCDEISRQTEVESFLDFTESEAMIHFKREGKVVVISADYALAEARVPLEELTSAMGSFARRVGHELSEQYPSIRRNQAFARLLPVPAR